MLEIFHLRERRDGSAVKGILAALLEDCEFSSKATYNDLLPSVILVLGYDALFWPCRALHATGAQTFMDSKTHTLKQ